MACMAHPPDRALSRAITKVIRQARNQGMTTRDIAKHMGGVAEPTVSRWESGDRQMALDALPKLDALVGQPRGYVLRLAGYVSDDNELDLRTAILTAPELEDSGRQILVDMYDVLRGVAGDAPVEPPAKPPRRVRNTART